MKMYLQVLFKATHWCRQWVLLHMCDESIKEMKDAYRDLETMVMNIFEKYGWHFRNRIE
jgi:hypothetical protein